MDPTGVRTWYIDSRSCTEQDDGSFQLNLWANIELHEGQAAYIDDVTIVSTMSNVTDQNNRLYLYEFTPTHFHFEGTVSSYNPTDIGRTQTTSLTVETRAGTPRFPQAYKCVLPNSVPSSTVYFDVDSTELHWDGVLSTGDENDPLYEEDADGNKVPIDYSDEDLSVQAQYSYLNGVAQWTANMPRNNRTWHFLGCMVL